MAPVVPREVEALLEGERVVAHLATCVDGRPHSAPLWYRYEDDQLEVLTTGVKLANLRQNPRVAVSIEQDDQGVPQWMVVLRGRATVIDDEAEMQAANSRINSKYCVDEEAWPDNVLVRIDIGSVASRTY